MSTFRPSDHCQKLERVHSYLCGIKNGDIMSLEDVEDLMNLGNRAERPWAGAHYSRPRHYLYSGGRHAELDVVEV